jgi:calcineurin-like phosphoesterase family protein
MEYFTADWHLGHDNIRRYCNRPFPDVAAMDAGIIARCNEKVGATDTLFVLGDITFRAARGLDEYLAQVNCRNIYLVFGNHDPRTKRGRFRITDPEAQLHKLFVKVDKAMTIRVMLHDDPVYIYLHHYACKVWDKSFHGSWHLYGHSHGNLTDDPNSLSMDVGVDLHDFYPLSLLEIAEFMKRKNGSAIATQQAIELECAETQRE